MKLALKILPLLLLFACDSRQELDSPTASGYFVIPIGPIKDFIEEDSLGMLAVSNEGIVKIDTVGTSTLLKAVASDEDDETIDAQSLVIDSSSRWIIVKPEVFEYPVKVFVERKGSVELVLSSDSESYVSKFVLSPNKRLGFALRHKRKGGLYEREAILVDDKGKVTVSAADLSALTSGRRGNIDVDLRNNSSFLVHVEDKIVSVDSLGKVTLLPPLGSHVEILRQGRVIAYGPNTAGVNDIRESGVTLLLKDHKFLDIAKSPAGDLLLCTAKRGQEYFIQTRDSSFNLLREWKHRASPVYADALDGKFFVRDGLDNYIISALSMDKLPFPGRQVAVTRLYNESFIILQPNQLNYVDKNLQMSPAAMPDITRSCIPINDRKSSFLVTTEKLRTYLVDSFPKLGRAIFKEAEITQASSLDTDKRLWLNDQKQGYLLVPPQQVLDLEIDPGARGVILTSNRNFPSTGWFSLESTNARGVRKSINPDSLKKLARIDGAYEIALDADGVDRFVSGEPYNINFHYTDSNGSDLTMTVSNVQFPKHLTERPEFWTIIALLATVAVTFGSQLFRGLAPGITRWFPLGLGGVQTTLGVFDDKTGSFFNERFDTSLFLIGLGVISLAAFASGIIRPSILRQLIPIAPFNWLAFLLVTVPSFRRRYFSEYIEDLKNVIRSGQGRPEADIKQAGNAGILTEELSVYSPVPAGVFTNGGAPEVVSNPSDWILDKLGNGGRAPTIVIVAPGGQGKSALLQSVLARYIKHFEESPHSPLPIYLNGTGETFDSVQAITKAVLNRYMISEEIIDREMEAGKYMIVIDGLSESSIQPSLLGTFVQPNSALGLNTAVLVTMRPHDGFEKELQKSSNFSRVHPQKLSDDTIGSFQEAYMGKGERLSGNQLRICRSGDGSYQPILVRLAILSRKEPKSDIVELYEASVRYLLKRIDIEADSPTIYTLCHDSYGRMGAREVVVTAGTEELIKKLYACGLLLPIDGGGPFMNPAKRYRFLHDSIQTYLTVEAFRASAEDQREMFFHFCSTPHFKKDVANFMFEEGSEMFQMAVLVFMKYDPTVPAKLLEDLKTWSTEYASDFSTRDVFNSMPTQLRNDNLYLLDLTPKVALQNSILHCKSTLAHTAELYYNFAQVVSHIQMSRPKDANERALYPSEENKKASGE